MFKDIPGFESEYAATTDGQIWSYKRKKFLAQRSDKDGYLRVTLSQSGKITTHLVHRLIALTFIENPEGKATVNHIDESKTHNNVNNLEWMTQAENVRHGTRSQRQRETMKKRKAAAASKLI